LSGAPAPLGLGDFRTTRRNTGAPALPGLGDDRTARRISGAPAPLGLGDYSRAALVMSIRKRDRLSEICACRQRRPL